MENFIDAFDEEMDEEMEYLEVLDYLEFGVPRQIYERNNHLDTMDASTFRKRFRLPKETVLNVLDQIGNELEFPANM